MSDYLKQAVEALNKLAEESPEMKAWSKELILKNRHKIAENSKGMIVLCRYIQDMVNRAEAHHNKIIELLEG